MNKLLFLILIIILLTIGIFIFQPKPKDTFSVYVEDCDNFTNLKCGEKIKVNEFYFENKSFPIDNLTEEILNEKCVSLIESSTWGCNKFLVIKD